MFRKKTVFILGAGASWHYGYPTGEDLVREVSVKAGLLSGYLRRWPQCGPFTPRFLLEWYLPNARGECPVECWDDARRKTDELTKRLKSVDPLVIDYFLGHNSEVADVGRLLVAWIILEREKMAADQPGAIGRIVKPGSQDNWCRFLIHRLSSGCVKPGHLLENEVTFVTFNYDVSLESYLRAGLEGIQLFDTTRAKFQDNNRFLHVYGRIREPHAPVKFLNTRAYSDHSMIANADLDPAPLLTQWRDLLDAAFAASKGIRTIDPADKAGHPDQVIARKAIYEAECIYILGFGFDPNNCDRLELATGIRPNAKVSAKRVMFTNLGDINRVNKSASRVFLGHGANALGPGVFLCNGPSGSVYEKSVRDCYDALSLDFDDEENY